MNKLNGILNDNLLSENVSDINLNNASANKEKEHLLDYFRNERIYQRLNAIASFLIKNNKGISFELRVGGGSFTDGKKIVVGFPEIFLDFSNPKKFSILKALVAHEASHIVDSNFKVMEDYLKKAEKYLADNYNLEDYKANYLAHNIFNAVEDGRIERRLVNRLRGAKKYIQFLNLSIWKIRKIENDELTDFFDAFISLCVVGAKTKGFDAKYNGTPTKEVLDSVRPLIDKGVREKTCKECSDVCFEILKEVAPYIVPLLEKIPQEQCEVHMEFTTSSDGNAGDVELKISPYPNIKGNNKDNSENEGGSSDKDNSENEGGLSDKDKSDKDNKDEEKGKGNGQGDKDDKKDGKDDKKDGKSGNENKSNNDNNNSKGKNGKDNKADDLDKNKPSSKSFDNDFDNDKKSNLNTSDEGLDEKRIEEILRELEQQTIDESVKILQTVDNEKKLDAKKAEKQEQQEKRCSVTLEDLKEINRNAKYTVKYNEAKLPGNLEKEHLIGKELKNSMVLKRELEKIFKNTTEEVYKNKRRGNLDTSSLWRLKLNQSDIFTRKYVPTVMDCVFYILVDGSGSMWGDKIEQAMHACAVLEESIKQLIPFKISVFSVNYDNTVNHVRVKGFLDKPKKYNMSLTALNCDLAGGGNNDGYSIRIATQELLKRPEQKKILIVLSDGLPSDCSFEHDPINDVKIAVQEARKKKVDVFSIFFGSEEDRKQNAKSYKYMYEKNIISSKPEDISKNLMQLFKRVYFSR